MKGDCKKLLYISLKKYDLTEFVTLLCPPEAELLP